jgi:hypothetical protein
MIAYNLNGWLRFFQRQEAASTSKMTYRATATSRLRMLFLAARITRHGGQTGVHFGQYYQKQSCFDRSMARIRAIRRQVDVYLPVIPVPLHA